MHLCCWEAGLLGLLPTIAGTAGRQELLSRTADAAGTGQALVAAGVTQQMLSMQPKKLVVYLTDRVHLLYQQAAVFASQLDEPVGK